MNEVLAYLAALLVFAWGVSHVIPTRRVVDGFGEISTDNRLVITQEWIAEAITMWCIAAVIVVITAVGEADDTAARWTYRASAVMLLAVIALTASTGARTAVVWFKICPLLLTTTAALLLAASLL
jgi:hypothetical protein